MRLKVFLFSSDETAVPQNYIFYFEPNTIGYLINVSFEVDKKMWEMNEILGKQHKNSYFFRWRNVFKTVDCARWKFDRNYKKT